MSRRPASAALALCAALAASGVRVPAALPSPSPVAQPSATAAAKAAASIAPAQTPLPTSGELFVRGSLLAIEGGYLFFTAGTGLRLATGTVIPKGAALGRSVLVKVDLATGLASAIEMRPVSSRPGEIDASALPPRLAALVPAPAPSGSAGSPGRELGSGPITVQFNVAVPGNTPPNDDIYIATDRSNFSPAEIHMQRSDPQHWTAALTIPGGTAVHYEYTRGSYSTVERDRFGGIIAPRALPASNGAKTNDTVDRWADLN